MLSSKQYIYNKKKMKIDPFNVFTKHQHLPYLFYPEINKINTNSWFNIEERKGPKYSYTDINTVLPNKKENMIKCKTILIKPTSIQKKILQQWFYSYTTMYNETIHYIRKKYEFTRHNIKHFNIKKSELSFFNLRKALMEQKKKIILSFNKKTSIYTHILDTAIHLCASNIKSAITNLKKKNIDNFRIKYWKYNRGSQTMEIEPSYIKDDIICKEKLGEMKYIYNGKEYKLSNIEKAVKINYNSSTDEYKLFIPEEFETEIKIKKNEIISLDPGLRTFMTGITQKRKVEIGSGINNSIEEYIKRLNRIKENDCIPDDIKKRNERMINRKIENKITDMHWKTIKYLTNNYDYILIGDMSAKEIVKRDSSILSKTQKVACLRTQYYKFNQRLEYKCKTKGVGFNIINESYTSKTCSICGHIKDDLGGDKIFKCEKCKTIMNRDVNGARNIYIKSQE